MSGREYGENERHYSTLSQKCSHLERKLLIIHLLHILCFYKAEYSFQQNQVVTMCIYRRNVYRSPEEMFDNLYLTTVSVSNN